MKRKILPLLVFSLFLWSGCTKEEKKEESFTAEIKDVETISFDQMVEQIALDEQCSQEEVQRDFLLREKAALASEDTKEDLLLPLKNTEYQMMLLTMPKVNGYEPQGLRLYMQKQQDETSSIFTHATLLTNDAQKSVRMYFHGQVFLNLEDSKTLYISIDGDVYIGGALQITSRQDIYGKTTGSVLYDVSNALEPSIYYRESWNVTLP